jgi:transcriptional regulator of acetoin/glycerol metabolism
MNEYLESQRNLLTQVDPIALIQCSDDHPDFVGLKKKAYQTVLEQSNGNIKRAAEVLGIPRTTLNDRLRKYNLIK